MNGGVGGGEIFVIHKRGPSMHINLIHTILCATHRRLLKEAVKHLQEEKEKEMEVGIDMGASDFIDFSTTPIERAMDSMMYTLS